MSDEGERTGNSRDIFSNTNFFIIIWVVFFVIFVCAHICMNGHRRALWWKRLQICRWNVQVDEETDEDWYRLALQHQDRHLARANQLGGQDFHQDEEDKIRQLYLLERMEGFTIIIEKDHICCQKAANEPTVPSEVTTNADIVDAVKGAEKMGTGTDLGAENLDKSTINGNSAGPDIDVEMGGTGQLAGTKTKGYDDSTDDGGNGNDNDESCGSKGDPFHIELGVLDGIDTCVQVAAAGTSLASMGDTRMVPNGCVICLCKFEEGHRLTWSSNTNCAHVFHEECLLQWMMQVGRKRSHRRRREVNTGADADRISLATDFPMLCPCCRQPFISREDLPPTHHHNQTNVNSASLEGNGSIETEPERNE